MQVQAGARSGGGTGGAGSNHEWVAGIANRGFLARLSRGLIDELIESAPSIRYPVGGVTLPHERQVAALVVSGVLRYYLSAADGRQLTIRYVGPGDLVGTLIMDPSDVNTRIEAIQPSLLVHVDVERMQALARRRPELALALTDELTSRLRHAFHALAARAFMSVRSRVASDLMERVKIDGTPHPGPRVEVTQQALADATGSVREVVGRVIGDMRRDGLISTDGAGITILDPDALARLAEAGAAPGRRRRGVA
jgi:CRP/FNR family transcriptional regulator, cyclic AMP receptor protein